MHPPGSLVEPLVDEELAPGGCAVNVQPFAARDLQLGAEEEAGVWIDEQQRMTVPGVRGRDGEAVRPLRLAKQQAAFAGRHRQPVAAIERLQLAERNALDIAA